MTSHKVAHQISRDSLEVNRMRSRLGERSRDREFVLDQMSIMPLVSFVDLISCLSVACSFLAVQSAKRSLQCGRSFDKACL